MPIKHAFSAFNGTVFRDRDQGKLWEHVGWKAYENSKLLGIHTPRTIGLALTALQLKKLNAAYKRGEIGYDEIYKLYNEQVLSGIRPQDVQTYVIEYAGLPETQQRVDGRLVRPLQAAHSDGLTGTIISTGFDYGIKYIMGVATNWHSPFDTIVANKLFPWRNGKETSTSWLHSRGSRFGLDIYSGEDKLHRLKYELSVSVDYPDPATVLFMGDSETDEACMKYIVGMGGRVAAPFFADDAFKHRTAKEYGAFVPESEQDFANFLRKA